MKEREIEGRDRGGGGGGRGGERTLLLREITK